MKKFHEEQKIGEIYLGNAIKDDFLTSAWQTKRLGRQAFDINGNKIDCGLRPWFIQSSEVEAKLEKSEEESIRKVYSGLLARTKK